MNSLLKGGNAAKVKRDASALNDIRQAMLDVLGDRGAMAYPMVKLRLTYANDVQDLWYLRGDVMAAIAALDGEATARKQLAILSAMFKGQLPSGLASRFSPLSP